MEKKVSVKTNDDFIYGQAFIMGISLAIAHLCILILFLYLHVKEMVIYNAISVIYFIAITFIAKSKKIGSSILIVMIDSEVILHQILAVYFVGLSFGFQYILLSMMVPMTLVLKNKKFSRYTVGKNIVSGIAFALLFFVYNNSNPIYVIDNPLFEKACTIVLVAFTIAIEYYLVRVSYRQLEKLVRESQEKEINENKKRIKIQGKIIDAIASIIESRDSSTGEHTIRTSRYVGLIANQLKTNEKYSSVITDEYIDNLTSAASLHDIGKISTPDHILNKPAKLDQNEYEIIKQHSVEGGKIIHKILENIEDEKYVQTAYEIATYHHERWDGKGYPDNLQGEDIPLDARIMAVADVYDALISSRCYKAGFTREKSTNIISEGRGTQFDPDIVDAFLELRKQNAL